MLATLVRRQAAVLATLLVLALGGYQTLEWTVAYLFDDGTLINVAGRQRMLSQRIIAYGFQSAARAAPEERARFRELMADSATEMKEAQAFLINESNSRGMSPELWELYFGPATALDSGVRNFVIFARNYAETADEATQAEDPLLQNLSDMARNVLLPGLEKVVARYEMESRANASRLQRYVSVGLLVQMGALVFAWFGVFRPMSNRLRQELLAHGAAEEQTRLILGSVGEGVIGLDPGGRVIFVNRAAEEMVGYGADEMIGRDSHQLLHHSHVDGSPYPAEDCPLTTTLRDGAKCSVEGEVFWRKDGGSVPIHYTTTPIDRPDGARGAVITFRDIGEQLAAQRALQASKEVKTSILNAALDAIVTVDRDGRIVEFNPAAERIFGVRAEAVIGHEVSDVIIPEEHRQAHLHGFARVVSGQPSRLIGQRLEMTALHAGGTILPVELTITHLPDHGLFTAFIRDLSDQKRTEAALQRSQKLEAVGHLTGGIAHDFNNLLGIIAGNLELLEKSVADNEKASKRVATALNSARRGADLTRRLLAFSRQDQASQGKAACDVGEVITGMHEMLQRTLTRRVEIRTVLAPDLWMTEINRSEFEDSLLNLAINARDAMPDGGLLIIEAANLVIAPEYRRIDPNLTAGDYVAVSVSDTGTGIAKDVLDHIFEPFFTTKERGKGTGLGLSMVYGFTKRSGGHIRAYSEVGTGTTFRLYLPRLTVAAPASPAVTDETANAMPRGAETVLVVDDEIHLAEIAGEFLSDLGYRTIVCGNPAEALTILERSDDIDLLFTDVVMPHGIDGFALERRVRELGRRCKVVFTSGFTGYAHNRPGAASELHRHLLVKPYGKADLARLVREVLDTSQETPPS
ncbi:PAS domain S-box protein [Magnetospirillum sp. SS-4]|uniref:PAS domain S-box protein n=1 Tax=Magnetospirillum sp. SS-4 TaxID=2681465 RepID=UPI0020C37138|nr:PAS domain S-box protein [Magnetospirillum sp. SS-4]